MRIGANEQGTSGGRESAAETVESLSLEFGDNVQMTRREFIAGGVGVAAVDFVFAGQRPLLKDEYSVSLLGDIHYDCPPIDRFHSEFRRLHVEDGMFARYQKEFESFSSMWGPEGRSAALVKASGLCRRRDSAFALQLGDLVEGDCESPTHHERMLADAYALMKKTYGESLPFVTVAGNHDVRRGADRLGEYDSYCRISAAWHTKELGVDVTEPTFAFWQGPDLWVVADFNRPDSDLIEKLLVKNRSSRYTFFCTHGAVLTSGNRDSRRWFFLGCPQYNAKGRRERKEWFDSVHPDVDAARRRIRRLLAQRNAIALTGHSHLLELRDWFGDGGRITEFVMNSVTKTAKGANVPDSPVVVGQRPEDFGRCRRSKHAKSSAVVEALYAEYEPGMRRYYTANAAGHARLRISDKSVVAEFFPGAAVSPCATFSLR